jgi:hypothetical protein
MTQVDMAFQIITKLLGSKQGRKLVLDAANKGDNGIKDLVGKFTNALPNADDESAQSRYDAAFDAASTPISEQLVRGLTSEAIPNAVNAFGDISTSYRGMLGKALRNLKASTPLQLSNKNAVDQQIEAAALQQDYKGAKTKAITDAVADTIKNTSDRIFDDRQFARQAGSYAANPMSAGAADYYGRQLTYANRNAKRAGGGKK